MACRVWWALKVHGHDQVYVLEGGWRAWVAAQGAEELTEPCPLKVDFRSWGSLLQCVEHAAALRDSTLHMASSRFCRIPNLCAWVCCK